MEKDYESIVEQVRKVKALADNGIDGEKENAKILLDKLLKKYNIDLNEFIEEKRKAYKFKYSNEHERRILVQCIAKFAPNIKTFKRLCNNKGSIIKNIIELDLTNLEYLDSSGSAKFYTKLLKDEMETFMTAFIHKHKLFGASNEDDASESTLSTEEIETIVNMMKAMKNSDFIPSRKQLGE